MSCVNTHPSPEVVTHMGSKNSHSDTATFAGGCFWCIEAIFLDLDGIQSVTSGYAGGSVPHPTYEQVCSGTTGHYEAVQVLFDSKVISYMELLDIFWRNIDPTDSEGSFADRGTQYRSAIFYHTPQQRSIAEASKKELEQKKIFKKPIVTEILPFTVFYAAEGYHQQFCKRNPTRYGLYKAASGREQFLSAVWEGRHSNKVWNRKNHAALTPLQYHVTQECGTEPPFQNEYWNNHREGIYVDVVTGEPLFSSTDKFDSGSGWPSFLKPIDVRSIEKKPDTSFGMQRVEVRSKNGGTHLGHVFDDGPQPTRLRYCINSSALRFVPKEAMESEGYGMYLWLFKNEK